MMLRVKDGASIYVASAAVDCRKAVNGLIAVVSEHYETPLQDGSVYVFYNRGFDLVKCIFWDKNGFALYQKRLEKGRFKMGKDKHDSHYNITSQQLDWLLAGLDFNLMHEFSDLDFTHYF